MNSRRLSQKAAWQCEYALNGRCRCRCAGKLHGAKRVDKSERLAELPADDPHYVARKRLIFMRDVFSASEPLRSRHHGFYRIVTLDCGHKRNVKSSRKIPARAHCQSCRLGVPPVPIAPAIRFRVGLQKAHKPKRSFPRYAVSRLMRQEKK